MKMASQSDLKNKVVLVTGSSSGIGMATVKKFAKEGCRVVVTYHKAAKEGKKVAAECKALGASDVLFLRCKTFKLSVFEKTT